MKLLTFQEAISRANTQKLHLLLGNGFSQAFKHDIFSYGSLLEKGDFNDLSVDAQNLFEKADTIDFEELIYILQKAAQVNKVYLPESSLEYINDQENDAKLIKEILVNTIAKHHPDFPNSIKEEQYSCCFSFLSYFSNIYTLNYDLLLYWVLMNGKTDNKENKVDDGFRHPNPEEDSDYVSWEIENTYGQNIFYLHGALHLFDSGIELKKYTWKRTGRSLMEQIREALDENTYPSIITEGTSEQKKKKIYRSAYLARGLKSLASIKDVLFVYGWSFADNDYHILKMIEKGKLSKIFVSIYGDPGSQQNKDLINKISQLPSKRSKKKPLEVFFYEATSACLWKK
jgi:uncharacterized protein DUF4917